MSFKSDNYPEHLPYDVADPEAAQRYEFKKAKERLIAQAAGSVALLGGPRKREGQRIVRATPWIPRREAVESAPTKLRLRQIEKPTLEILGFAVKRRISELRVEEQDIHTTEFDPNDPRCIFFMKPEHNQPPIIHRSEGTSPADRSRWPVLPTEPAWEELQSILSSFGEAAVIAQAAF